MDVRRDRNLKFAPHSSQNFKSLLKSRSAQRVDARAVRFVEGALEYESQIKSLALKGGDYATKFFRYLKGRFFF